MADRVYDWAEPESERLDAELEGLERRFPELQRSERAARALELAVSRAEALGHPEWATVPWFIEEVWVQHRESMKAWY